MSFSLYSETPQNFVFFKTNLELWKIDQILLTNPPDMIK